MSEIERAWAAGLFDGEGWAGLDVHGYLRISVGQTDTDVLLRFRDAVGVGTINGPYQRRAGCSSLWEFGARSWDAEHALDLIWPFLGSVKRQQATTARASARRSARPGYCWLDLHRIEEVGRARRGGCLECRRAAYRRAWRAKRARAAGLPALEGAAQNYPASANHPATDDHQASRQDDRVDQ